MMKNLLIAGLIGIIIIPIAYGIAQSGGQPDNPGNPGKNISIFGNGSRNFNDGMGIGCPLNLPAKVNWSIFKQTGKIVIYAATVEMKLKGINKWCRTHKPVAGIRYKGTPEDEIKKDIRHWFKQKIDEMKLPKKRILRRKRGGNTTIRR